MALLGKSRAGRLLPVSCFGIIAAAGVAHAELRITEVMPNGSGTNEADEWIEIYNAGADAIDLSAYRIGDEETVGGGEGFYAFPVATLAPGHSALVTRNATAFAAVGQSLTPAQQAQLTALRRELGDDSPQGAYLYSDPIDTPLIPSTDFLFGN